MKVTILNPFTNGYHTEDLDVTQEQLDRYSAGVEKVQDIFPHLNADEREFLISGTPIGEFDKMFPKEDEDL